MKLKFFKDLSMTAIVSIFIIVIGIIFVIGAFFYGKALNLENNRDIILVMPETTHNFKAPTDEQKKEFVIKSNMQVSNNVTKISGTVRNGSNSTKNIQLVAKIYKNDGKIDIVNQIVIDKLYANEVRNFDITFQGDYSGRQYVVDVEYIE